MDQALLRQARELIARRMLRRMLFHMPLAEAQTFWEELPPEHRPRWANLWKRETVRRRDTMFQQRGLAPTAKLGDLVSEGEGWAALYRMSPEQAAQVNDELIPAARRYWERLGAGGRTRIMLELRGGVGGGGGGSAPPIQPQASGLITGPPPTDGGFKRDQGNLIWDINRPPQPIDEPAFISALKARGASAAAVGGVASHHGGAAPSPPSPTGERPSQTSMFRAAPEEPRRGWGRALLVYGVAAGALATWHRRGRRQSAVRQVNADEVRGSFGLAATISPDVRPKLEGLGIEFADQQEAGGQRWIRRAVVAPQRRVAIPGGRDKWGAGGRPGASR